tara:strand:+ start:9651 stop:10775 length:1125 start_codon:yes stop_codon:yes gene_type:complete
LIGKIIIIGPAFPFRGGIANFNNSLALEYFNRGYEVKVFSFSLQYPSVFFPGKTQYENGDPPRGIKIEPIINSINPFNWIRVGLKVLKEKPDYVIFRYWIPFMAPCLGTIAKIIRKKIKIIAVTDNIIPHEKRLGDTILTRFFITKCHAFLTLSSSVLNDLKKFTDTNNKIFIPHPIYDSFGSIVSKQIARNFLNLDLNGKYLLFFGFIREYKGLDLLLESFSDPRIKSLGIKLIIAGEFYENKEKYISLIKKKKLENHVILRTDFIPQEEVKYYFCASDMVTQTYRTATQSGVTQIGYHFEKPMLVTNVGGLSEIIPHYRVGYVCDINSTEIANSIIDFYNNNMEVEFIKNLKIEKKRFSWKVLVDGIENLIK